MRFRKRTYKKATRLARKEVARLKGMATIRFQMGWERTLWHEELDKALDFRDVLYDRWSRERGGA